MLKPPRSRNLGPVLHAEHYHAAKKQLLQALDHAGPEEQGPAPEDDRPPWETGGGT